MKSELDNRSPLNSLKYFSANSHGGFVEYGVPSFQNRCIFPHALSMKRLVDPQFVAFLTRVTLYLTVAKV